jgi:predicted nucleic acid-binding protein
VSIPRSIRERWVYIDSSAYLALLDVSDANHAAALLILRWLSLNRYRLYTTNALLIECHALIMSCLGRHVAARFLQDVDASNTVIVRVRANDETRAKAIVYRYDDKDFSFNDALSFVIMERLGIQHVFTFDDDFTQYGYLILDADRLP